jgi:formylglycine-generating enzyme required for sulfatase activity
MTAISKLLLALTAGALVVSLTEHGSAKSRTMRPEPAPAAQQAQTPPAPLPKQYFPEKSIQPLIPELERALKPKDSFKECDVCPEMVVVPKGSFMMGTPARTGRFRVKTLSIASASQSRSRSAASPFRSTNGMPRRWRMRRIKGDDKGFGRGRMPAQGINFEAAKSYLAWLSKKVGRTYRLPSESEREYFTRAGTTTPFWFGNTISAQDANYQASTPYGGGPRGPDSKRPMVVDSYAPNPFGLYQVHGNVFEWTEDCFNKRYNEDTPADGSPWLEGDCHKRMLRGGTWDWSANMVRSGYRENAIVDGGGYSFRVVRTLNVQP